MKKTGDDALMAVLERITGYATIVDDASLFPYMRRARDIINHIDPDDAIFIACCLAIPGSALWSDDKALKQQATVRVISTEELLRELSG